MNNAVRLYGDSGYSDATKQERTEVLLYALAVLIPTTLIVACFPRLHVINNWAANTLMFIPGLMAVAFRLQRREGFRSVGWAAGAPVYWL